MATNKKIESAHFWRAFFTSSSKVSNSLIVGIITLKHLQSSVKEASIPGIYEDYLVTQTDRQTHTDSLLQPSAYALG